MRYIVALVFLLGLVPFTTSAQSSFFDSGLSISVSPPYPDPLSEVILTLQSPYVNLDATDISWTIDGESLESGDNLSIVRVTTPELGDEVTYTARVGDEQASVTIRPATVDVLYEAETYAPSLYKGRHAASAGSSVVLQAIPRIPNEKGVSYANSSLTFTWKRDGQILTRMSGKGKDVLRVNLEPYMEPESFTVTVLSPDKTVGAQRSITIRPSEPILELYFDHPLYGTLFHSALGAETNIYDEEMSFVAVPYFTSRISASTGYTYAWSVNGTTIAPNTSRPSLLTINAAQSTGKALVKLEVRHPSNPFLSSLNSWPLTFTRAGGTPTQGSSANPFIQ